MKFSVGILYAYCIGPYVSYILFQWLCLVVPLLFIATFTFMPDTPHFYILRGNRVKAMNSLKYFRGADDSDVEEEMNEIEHSVIESMDSKAGIIELFKERANFIGNVTKLNDPLRFFFLIHFYSFDHCGWLDFPSKLFGDRRCVVLQRNHF